MDQNPKQQVVDRIKSATNILVTVSTNPSVDQLAACIGFTLMLNKLGKHATAVFSGTVPSTLEFLQPEKTIEKNTDSLQDFIIALDKSKADKLRYKVENDVVRIFITPYRTSISEKDLEFSLGDFNVDAVVALGVTKKEEIDQAIIAHGRILHDATVMAVTAGDLVSNVGSINWQETTASSLSEMLVGISDSFQSGLLDPQMATSFLTGIVAETDRFSNDKTSPKVMTMSAQLMAAGANQQLIATKLMPPPPEPTFAPAPEVPPADGPAPAPEQPAPAPAPPKHDGEIDIPHEHGTVGEGLNNATDQPSEDEIHIDDQGNLKQQAELEAAKKRAKEEEDAREAENVAAMAVNPDIDTPNKESAYIASDGHQVLDPLPGQSDYDPLLPDAVLSAAMPPEPAINLPPVSTAPTTEPVVENPAMLMSEDQVTETLSQLEQDVQSPHLSMIDSIPPLDSARQAVATAGLDTPPPPQASQALGAQHFDLDPLPDPMPAPAEPLIPPPTPVDPVVPPTPPVDTMATGVGDILQATGSGDSELPAMSISGPALPPAAPAPSDQLAPPPVPPPMTAPYFEPKTSHHNPYLNPDEKPKTDDPNSAPV